MYAREAVTCFIEALKLTQGGSAQCSAPSIYYVWRAATSSSYDDCLCCSGSRLEDTIRLLVLLFELSEGHITPDIRNGLKKLPPEMWLEVCLGDSLSLCLLSRLSFFHLLFLCRLCPN